PDGVIARPGAFDADAVAGARRYAIQALRRVVPQPARHRRARAVLAVERVFGGALHEATARITIAAARRAADAVVRQVFFIAVDADQVLERAGDAGLLVRLEFWKIDHNVGFEHFPGDEVLVTARRVSARHQAWVVAGDAERGAAVGHRLK